MALKAIVTRQNDNGTYDEVGMNNRRVLIASAETYIVRQAHKLWQGKTKRVELFHDYTFYKNEPPHKTLYI